MPTATPANDAHYQVTFQGVRLDPYRILVSYGITHPAQQHAIKKLLRAGRSIKDTARDIDEVIMALQRWKQMLAEDTTPPNKNPPPDHSSGGPSTSTNRHK